VPTDTVEYDEPFNELFLLNVDLVDQEPQRLPIRNVLWAGWAPCGRGPCTRIAYSTGEKSGSPGWRANNDLWTVTLLNRQGEVVQSKPKRIVGTQTVGAYSWWGSRYAWSPDGLKVAYARPDQVGWIEMRTGRVFPLAPFSPLTTHRDQVWVPTPTWSPDSQFVACTIHGEEPGRSAEQSRVFEVWALDLEQEVRARLTRAVGMWSAPRWSPPRDGESTIAYAEAQAPFGSLESRYTLKLMDRDGSNKRAIFPNQGQNGDRQSTDRQSGGFVGPFGLVGPVVYSWSPDGQQIVVLHLGDLYRVDLAEGQMQQLTGDGQSTHVEWAK
jgi:Tol biopolymer transport system component